MENNKKILIAVGSALGLIAIYMYYKKKTSSSVIKPADVIKSASVITNPESTSVTSGTQNQTQPPITSVVAPANNVVDTVFKLAPAVIKNTPIPQTSTAAAPVNETAAKSDTTLSSSPGIDMKDTTLENSNSTLGSLTTQGKDYSNIDNPTGYVDNKFPPTIDCSQNPDDPACVDPILDTAKATNPDEITPIEQAPEAQVTDNVLDSAVVSDNTSEGDSYGGSIMDKSSDIYGYGGVPSS